MVVGASKLARLGYRDLVVALMSCVRQLELEGNSLSKRLPSKDYFIPTSYVLRLGDDVMMVL